MINRELIRIKVVQLTYAYYQNGNKNMDVAEKELFFSLSKAYDLYNYLLELIVAVTKEERLRVEIATQRAQREGTELPSQKFAYNKFAVQLEENKMLNDFVEAQKQTWADRSEEHTSELQSRQYLVCRLLLEKKHTDLLIRTTPYHKQTLPFFHLVAVRRAFFSVHHLFFSSTSSTSAVTHHLPLVASFLLSYQ